MNRFFLFATEVSVLVFGLASGHLDSRRGVRRVAIAASMASFIFIIPLAVLELGHHGVESDESAVFGHGGVVFLTLSSALFALIYGLVLALPFSPCQSWSTLPHRRSFYFYVGFLLALNLIRTTGGCLLLDGIPSGLCLINTASYFYYSFYAAVVYFTFLTGFLNGPNSQHSSLLFTYKAQVNNQEELFDADDWNMDDGNNYNSSLQFHNEDNGVEAGPIVINRSIENGNFTQRS